jgi:hypothetical protein
MKIKTKHIRYIAPICIIAMFFLPSITHAQAWNPFGWVGGLIGDTATAALGEVLAFFKSALSTILKDTVTPLLNAVMSYQNFFTNGVNAGWRATRDFANLFFALILLFIAIATVLNTGGLDNFTAKRMLPKFIFAALLINFSKAIVGFLIDISQIIMISLYNTFGPTLTDSIGSASKIAQAATEADKIGSAIINLLTIILIVILIFVFLWTAMILVVRIITLWFVIMTSPLAFVSSMIPGLSSFYNDWKTKLQEALITGPVLMFLLYLAVTVMNAGVNPNEASGGNLLNNGNILNYVLVIGLVILANIQAQKAGQQGPPIISKAVGVAGTIATLGIGGYIGAGGYKTSQALKTTGDLAKGGVKNVDKLAGGLTNTAGVVGGVTGIGALKTANQSYESAKKDLKEKQKTGVGFVGRFQGFSAEGKKEQLEDFEKQKAIRLFNEGKLEEKGNERYQKMAATLQAATATGVKDEFNIEKLGQDMKKALDDGDKFTAMALSTRISELKGWSQIFKEASDFSKYGKENSSEAEQLDAFINDNFERKDANGKVIKDANGKVIGDKITNSFRSRQANILNDKGAGNFAAGLAERDVKNPNYSPATKAAKAGIIGAGAAYAKNSAVFNVRDTDANNNPAFTNGEQAFKFNIKPILASIEGESLSILRKSETWNQFGKDRKTIKEGLEAELKNPSRDKSLDSKITAALQGLDLSSGGSRVTVNNT